MGLTIHYTLRCPQFDAAAAQDFTEALWQRANEACQRGAVEQVLPISSDAAELARWARAWKLQRDPEQPENTTGISIEPEAGWIFPVALGAECELLWLGLCRYPARAECAGRRVATGLANGWKLSGACKTQYARVRGWEHFRRCHREAIALLRGAADLGAKVRILDEGNGWPHRSERALRETLAQYNGMTAALAGAVKDDEEALGRGGVAAPIFEHPHFERLEAEGLVQNGNVIPEAAKLIGKLGPFARGTSGENAK